MAERSQRRGLGHSVSATAKLVGVTRRTVQRWRKKKGLERRANAVTGGSHATLRGALAHRPTLTLRRLQAHLQEQCGLHVSQSTICRWLRPLRITRKVVSLWQRPDTCMSFGMDGRPSSLSTSAAGISTERGSNRGYAPRGQRAVVARPAARGQRFTWVLVMGLTGGHHGRGSCADEGSPSGSRQWRHPLAAGSPGSMAGPLFQQFLAALPLARGSHLVMDNARIHHASASLSRADIPTIRETLHSRGVAPLSCAASRTHRNRVPRSSYGMQLDRLWVDEQART